MYYEGWNPGARSSAGRGVPGFLREVERAAPNLGSTQAAFAVTAVTRVLQRHISQGEIDDVMAILPAALRELLAHAQDEVRPATSG
ncbi:DUF2267 domain-containing protein [Baekduia soli]|uniref:DUF2267 domain-containing protein n=1 Tax=Baekduia soli TaxID=496014 RepID=UPI00225E151A|nr:DUF2267 domain-containing protein [Baekduia soli]